MRKIKKDSESVQGQANNTSKKNATLAHTDILRLLPIREKRATFIPSPGLEGVRPVAATSVDGFVLAGDWTATGLPATIEGAIRSGITAANQLLSASQY